MKKTLIMLACVLGLFAFLALMTGLGWLGALNDLAMFRYFAPRREAARRQTFEESKAFNQGMVQELDAMFREYSSADAGHRAAIRSIALHRVADYPADRLPVYLRDWVITLRTPSTTPFKEASK